MFVGPWQPRSFTCEPRTAGVASVISAVETSPVLKPAFCASSRIVVSGETSVLPATVEMRPLLVLCPVDQAVPVAAESGTYSGKLGLSSRTDQVVYSP